MKSFRWYDHISINVLWLAINIRNNAVGSLFIPFLVDMFVREDIKNSALGGLRTVGLIAAMLAQPVFGLLSDRNTSRFGRRKPFIFIGILLDLVFLAAIYFAWDYPSLVIALFFFQITSNMSHGPLQALIPDLVPEKQRGISSGVKAIFELLPLILVGFLIARLVSIGHFDWAVLATGGSMLVIMLIFCLLIKEPRLEKKLDQPFWPPMMRVLGMLAGILAGAAAGILAGGALGGLAGLIAWPILGERAARITGISLAGLVAMITAIGVGVWAGVRSTVGKQVDGQAVARAPFTWWIINRLFFLAAVTSLQSFAPFFFMFAFQIDREAAAGLTGSLLTMVGIFTLVSAMPGGWISDRIGHKRVLAVSGITASLSTFALLTAAWFPSVNLIYFQGAVLGLATGLFMASNWALGTNLVPPGESGRFMGISNLAGAGAGIVGAGLGGPIADSLNAISPGLGYYVLFGCYGILFILSTISLAGIRIPIKTDHPAVVLEEAGQSPV